MENFLNILKKHIIPHPLFLLFQGPYHFILAFLGALIYGFPSRKLCVIGVTGTKGKTTTCYLITQILNEAGLKTGMTSSVFFCIGDREWRNDTKHAMPGRFQLQKLLAEMAREGCRYAVVETSSEGILQYRHRFIDYDIAVFTNLAPEHIERHGSFESYRSAKLKLFEKVAKKESGIGVYNIDDENVEYFLEPNIARKYGYALFDKIQMTKSKFQINDKIQISNIRLSPQGTEFNVGALDFYFPLTGEFNVYNAAAAISVALSQNVPVPKIQEALKNAKPVPGRLEVVDCGQDFTLIIDYAHEPLSLESLYKTVTNIYKCGTSPTDISEIRAQISEDSRRRMICLLGAQGGGRDKWKRSKMGETAARYCDEIILTNEDPYDEDPLQILNDIEKGIRVDPRGNPRTSASTIYKIIDRKEAIKKAISLAETGDVVILTGKGGEVWMCVEGGKKIPWNERKVVEEILSTKS